MGASYQSSSNPLHPCSLVPTPQPIKHLLHPALILAEICARGTAKLKRDE